MNIDQLEKTRELNLFYVLLMSTATVVLLIDPIHAVKQSDISIIQNLI